MDSVTWDSVARNSITWDFVTRDSITWISDASDSFTMSKTYQVKFVDGASLEEGAGVKGIKLYPMSKPLMQNKLFSAKFNI
jgi:hypothetical protein